MLIGLSLHPDFPAEKIIKFQLAITAFGDSSAEWFTLTLENAAFPETGGSPSELRQLAWDRAREIFGSLAQGPKLWTDFVLQNS